MTELRIAPFDPKLRQQLKILAAINNITLRQLVTDALAALVKKELKP